MKRKVFVHLILNFTSIGTLFYKNEVKNTSNLHWNILHICTYKATSDYAAKYRNLHQATNFGTYISIEITHLRKVTRCDSFLFTQVNYTFTFTISYVWYTSYNLKEYKNAKICTNTQFSTIFTTFLLIYVVFAWKERFLFI